MQIVSTVGSAESTARRLFLDDPGRSIDEVARELSNSGLGLKKDILSRIRYDVRRAIDGGLQPKHTPPLLRRRNPFDPKVQVINPVPAVRPEPFNPPRLIPIKTMIELPPVSPPPVVHAVPNPPTPPAPEPEAEKPTAPLEDRKRWLEDWLLENPDASVTKAREALHRQFGITMSTTTISDLVKTVRALREPDPAPRMPERTAEAPGSNFIEIADLAHAMRGLGVKRIELVGLHYIIEFEGRPAH